MVSSLGLAKMGRSTKDRVTVSLAVQSDQSGEAEPLPIRECFIELTCAPEQRESWGSPCLELKWELQKDGAARVCISRQLGQPSHPW